MPSNKNNKKRVIKIMKRIRNFGKLIVVFCLGTILIVICLIFRVLIFRVLMSKEDLLEMNRKTLISRPNKKHMEEI